MFLLCKTFNITFWNQLLEIVGEESPMRPQKPIVELSDRDSNKEVNKREKEDSLSKYHDIVDFVDEIVANIYGVNDNEDDRDNLSNDRDVIFTVVMVRLV